MAQTVLLHGRDSHRIDGEADGTVTPGELVAVTGGEGDARTYAAHSDEAGVASPIFALEYSHTGMDIDDDYSDGEHMELRHCVPGDKIYAFLADGEDVDTTDHLVSDGAGALQAYDSAGGDESGAVVARPLEDLDNSAGGAVARLKVEVV